ncbi:MAG: UvrD-helicase domain-containing protein [bacterium]|nr:UvrD-helicase domain-containing protein [bacterium]
MSFYADLHIHSKYSRATSRTCDLEHLYIWACKKGVSVVATGDVTHPEWRNEIREKLEPAESGLFRLRADLESEAESQVIPSCRGDVRYLLSVEIATIYKKGDRTRKVHHVIYLPDFDCADRFAAALSRIGNLNADGRPILGLDSRDLLEIVLESGEGAFLVPAHIWTPWFSAMGSKSGFDSVDECYGDLAQHVFAVETGLSTDPAMHWRLTSLDRFRLVSNSDAHSPSKLGRNACVFECDMDYFTMRRALETGVGYGGTVEFYPQEGKYHLDGHRKCGVRFTPEETKRHGGLCPVCGKPVTVGVMHRVVELADRPEGSVRPDPDPYRNLIPLPEVLSELEGVGAGSKRVARTYEMLLNRLGPELPLLEHVPLDRIGRHASPQLVEAIRRMREGEVIREAGYDGEFGVIRLFTPEELAAQHAGGLLFPVAQEERANDTPVEAAAEDDAAYEASPETPEAVKPVPKADAASGAILDGLDPDQRAAAECVDGPLLIVAGPGTGKTRTITHRIAHLVADHGVAPESCLAITFTRRAAQEMAERLTQLMPGNGEAVAVRTFHALGLEILREHAPQMGLPDTFSVGGEPEREALLAGMLECSAREAKRWRQRIALAKRQDTAPEPSDRLATVLVAYERALRAEGLVDFEDLIALPVGLLEENDELAREYRDRFRWISIDEYQDIDALQYRLVRMLAPSDRNLCAIGDPDQSIYSFRGADVAFFERFQQDYPAANEVRLKRSYRCARPILDASGQVMGGDDADGKLETLLDSPDRVVMHGAPTDRAEAEFVVQTVEDLIGGHSHFSIDSGRSEGQAGVALSFSDLAVLYRTDAQADALCEALARSGIPYQRCTHRRLAEDPVAQALVSLVRSGDCDGESVLARLRDAADRLRSEAKGGRLGPEWAWEDSDASAESDRPDLETRLTAALTALEPLAGEAGDDAVRFLDRVALGVDADAWDPRAERVSLMTLHAAKGLEFEVVFVTGCEKGLLPLVFGGEATPGAMEEERRLFYVGMTRARRRLVLSHARKRRIRGRVRPMAPSPFLAEIEERLLEHRATTARRKAPRSSQMDLF